MHRALRWPRAAHEADEAMGALGSDHQDSDRSAPITYTPLFPPTRSQRWFGASAALELAYINNPGSGPDRQTGPGSAPTLHWSGNKNQRRLVLGYRHFNAFMLTF